jgi:hypothetical protein
LLWCHKNRDKLREMRSAARERALLYSWANFRAGVRNALGIPPSSAPSGQNALSYVNRTTH